MTDLPDEPQFVQKSFFDTSTQELPTGAAYPFLTDAERDALFVSLFALSSIKGIGYRTLLTMFKTGFLRSVFELDLDELTRQWSYVSNKPNPDLVSLLYEQRGELKEVAHNKVQALRKQGIEFVPIGHSSYPTSLFRLANKPLWLFVKGNLDVIRSRAVVAVVGTRNPSVDGQRLAYACARELVINNIVVLSGLAKGIDERAHWGAVDYYGQSIGILGNGITASHASMNQALITKIIENDGAVISEYMPDDPPSGERFLRRNELQAAMARAVIPVESPSMESGTGATIRRAKALDTPLIGVAWPASNEQSLIDTQANLQNLGCPIFPVGSENSGGFWEYLAAILSDVQWDSNPRMRQDRFFRSLHNQIKAQSGKLGIDRQAINRFVEQLRDSNIE